MPAKYKLTYFNVRARGETARCIFAAAEVDYEDNRITMEEWVNLKPKTPFGQLPVLEVDGRMISQSLAISRFIANETKLAGKDAVEAAIVDSVADALQDMSSKIITASTAADAEKKKEIAEGIMTQTLTALENLLKSNKGGEGYFVGDSITWADIHFMTHCDYLTQVHKFPTLSALNDRVRANKGIAAWLKKRPVTDM